MPCVFPCPGVEGACAGHVGDWRETQHASHGAWGDVQPETGLGYPMVDGGCRADVVAFTLGEATVLCIPRSLYIESWAGVDDEMLFDSTKWTSRRMNRRHLTCCQRNTYTLGRSRRFEKA